ncbi:MAG TPA: GLUG motif-containing protein [Clostridiales bacterium]|nr:GLUG motif-containing protein [Clostridiales bacterium]
MGKKTSFWTFTAALILFFFLAFPMGVSAADFPYGIHATGQYPFDDGDGTKDDPFLISTPQQLAQLAYDVAQDVSYRDQYLKLTADLDLDGLDWQPIGASATEEFMGHFDGNHKTVENLSIGSSATPSNLQEVGLFGYVAYATIQHLTIENAAVYSSLPGYYGEIGILAGDVTGTLISFCSASGSISASSRSGSTIGGLVGSIDSSKDYGLVGCSATVDILVASEYDGDVGGLIGESSSPMIACNATGNLSGDGYLGGLAGDSNATIVDCFATGNISSSEMAGGLVGNNDGNIYNSYATGAVYGYKYSGGLVGYHSYYNSLIGNCYATGNVSAGAGSSDGGGLIGCSGSMLNSYAAGQVTNGQGLTEYLYAATAVNCFWNSSLNATGGAGLGKTTSELQDPSFLLLLNDPALTGRKPFFRDWIIVTPRPKLPAAFE